MKLLLFWGNMGNLKKGELFMCRKIYVIFVSALLLWTAVMSLCFPVCAEEEKIFYELLMRILRRTCGNGNEKTGE